MASAERICPDCHVRLKPESERCWLCFLDEVEQREADEEPEEQYPDWDYENLSGPARFLGILVLVLVLIGAGVGFATMPLKLALILGYGIVSVGLGLASRRQ